MHDKQATHTVKMPHTLPVALLLLLPGTAHAQYVPPWLAAAALSPVLVLFLAIILGLLRGSWKTGLKHAGFVILWVVLFVITAQTIENDYVIWTPIVLYGLHTLLILALITINIFKRMSTNTHH